MLFQCNSSSQTQTDRVWQTGPCTEQRQPWLNTASRKSCMLWADAVASWSRCRFLLSQSREVEFSWSESLSGAGDDEAGPSQWAKQWELCGAVCDLPWPKTCSPNGKYTLNLTNSAAPCWISNVYIFCLIFFWTLRIRNIVVNWTCYCFPLSACQKWLIERNCLRVKIISTACWSLNTFPQVEEIRFRQNRVEVLMKCFRDVIWYLYMSQKMSFMAEEQHLK